MRVGSEKLELRSKSTTKTVNAVPCRRNFIWLKLKKKEATKNAKEREVRTTS